MNRFVSFKGIALVAILAIWLILCGTGLVWLSGSRGTNAPANNVCRNLLQAGYLRSESECVISQRPPDYIEGMIPLGVDEIYVRTAMEGFVLEKESRNTCYRTTENEGRGDICFRLLYRIKGSPQNPLSTTEYYSFGFRNGILTARQWDN